LAGTRRSTATSACAPVAGPRMAHLCRFGSQPHPGGPQTLLGRGLRPGTRSGRLRFGCHHHRLVPVAVPVGRVPADQECHQIAHPVGSAWQPTFIHITAGKVHKVNILDELLPEAGAIYVMGRGYLDFFRLHDLTEAAAFFVIRAKSNLACKQLYSSTVDRSTGLLSDQTIKLTGPTSAKFYPGNCAVSRCENSKPARSSSCSATTSNCRR